MPLCDDFEDEPTIPEHWKFDDCGDCVNRMKPRTCRACKCGDLFEEQEPAGLDSIFR